MLCGMFEEVGFGQCHAVEGEHVPTMLERERYCHSTGQGCPILAAYQAQGRPLKLSMYLDTWSLPPADTEAGRSPIA